MHRATSLEEIVCPEDWHHLGQFEEKNEVRQ